MRATEIAAALAVHAEAVCQHLLPQGRAHLRDWCCGSLGGEPGDSLKIRLAGSKAGVWADFGGAQSDKGDLIGLWQRTRGVDLRTACEEACEWLNIPHDQQHAPNTYVKPRTIETRAPSPTWVRLQQSLRKGTLPELQAVAELRQLPSTAGLELATRAGQLFFADVFDDGFEWPSWIVTDGSRRNAQARRMDGQPWAGIGGKKAKTIAGCEASWPIGISEATTDGIALVEGGPDFLAAWHFIWATGKKDVSPVAMLGAAQPIHPEALPMFQDRKVWIIPHKDDNRAGEKGAAFWRTQLEPIARVIAFFDFPAGVKDLNDLAVFERAMEDNDVY